MFGLKFLQKALLRRTISLENPFIRFYSARNLKSRSKKSAFLSVQTVEKCIARLRTKLENEQKQRASGDTSFSKKSLQNEHELLYKFISKPEQQSPVSIGNNALSPLIVERIRISSEKNASNLTWSEKLSLISSNGGFDGLTTSQVNRMIYSIPSEERFFLKKDIFDMMRVCYLLRIH